MAKQSQVQKVIANLELERTEALRQFEAKDAALKHAIEKLKNERPKPRIVKPAQPQEA